MSNLRTKVFEFRWQIYFFVMKRVTKNQAQTAAACEQADFVVDRRCRSAVHSRGPFALSTLRCCVFQVLRTHAQRKARSRGTPPLSCKFMARRDLASAEKKAPSPKFACSSGLRLNSIKGFITKKYICQRNSYTLVLRFDTVRTDSSFVRV